MRYIVALCVCLLFTFATYAYIVIQDNFDRIPGNDLGGSWAEFESSSASMSIVNTRNFSGDLFPQTNGLAVIANLGSNFAYWDTPIENNQVARITTIFRPVSGSDVSYGIGVRMSGTRSNFSGYVAALEAGPFGFSVTVYLRKYTGIDITTGNSGTVLGAQNLTVPLSAFNSWGNRGDILELRATGNNIEVFFWSAVGANNLGRIIAVTDNTIQSGNFGIFSGQSLVKSYLTNFYGNGF